MWCANCSTKASASSPCRFGGEPVAPFLADADKALVIETLDITSPQALIELCRRHGVTRIVHLAGTPIGVMAPAEEYWINMGGLLNVIEAARIVGARDVSNRSAPMGRCTAACAIGRRSSSMLPYAVERRP
jgi:hypothetical protein